MIENENIDTKMQNKPKAISDSTVLYRRDILNCLKLQNKSKHKETSNKISNKKIEGKFTTSTNNFNELYNVIDVSEKGKIMLNYLKKEYPKVNIVLDNSSYKGHIDLNMGSREGKITVGTKNQDSISQTLFHEISHILVANKEKIKGMDKLVYHVFNLNKKYQKPLFSISNNSKLYKTEQEKATEDVCELVAMYARDDGSFDKHLNDLQNGGNKKLANISEFHVKMLRNLCKNVISNIAA